MDICQYQNTKAKGPKNRIKQDKHSCHYYINKRWYSNKKRRVSTINYIYIFITDANVLYDAEDKA